MARVSNVSESARPTMSLNKRARAAANHLRIAANRPIAIMRSKRAVSLQQPLLSIQAEGKGEGTGISATSLQA